MHFEYEISEDDYVAGQNLYLKISRGSARWRTIGFWIAAGLVCIIAAFEETTGGWNAFLLGGCGGLLLYSAFVNLFPSRHFRRGYKKQDLVGKRFAADLNDLSLTVKGEFCTWEIRWPAIKAKGENDQAFMLFSSGTIFIFGKRYLSTEQQQELRRLSRLGQRS